jgi:catechol-2,3-dioxygenase
MSMPVFTLLYVASPSVSADFYAKLLGKPPVEASPTFVMFGLSEGHILGLWGSEGVLPAPDGSGARTELAFALPNRNALEATRIRWLEAGGVLLQDIAHQDFGENLLVADPDGHRLRAFVPAMH